MKRLVLFCMTLVLVSSCAVSIGNSKKSLPQDQDCEPKVVEKIIEVDKEVGYLKTPSKTYTASSGDDSVVDLWDQYIQVHNDRNIDAIMEMESDDIQIWGPEGEYIKGKEAHAQFLAAWFEGANPMWNTFFSFPMKVNDMASQNNGQWVVSGAQVTMSVESDQLQFIHLFDVYFENGKVNKFYVYQRIPTPEQ